MKNVLLKVQTRKSLLSKKFFKMKLLFDFYQKKLYENEYYNTNKYKMFRYKIDTFLTMFRIKQNYK